MLGKRAVTATEMQEAMISHSRPTRVEIWWTLGVCLRQYFSPCRLQASLTRSAAQMCTRIRAAVLLMKERVCGFRATLGVLCARAGPTPCRCHQRKKEQRGASAPLCPFFGGPDDCFAKGEYALALRLTSELADLRAGHVHPYSRCGPFDERASMRI